MNPEWDAVCGAVCGVRLNRQYALLTGLLPSGRRGEDCELTDRVTQCQEFLASLTPGTSITSLWLLRSRPDQIHKD